ncbi:MAG: FAD:protein FMN transferase, partial [Bacteroidales bacterium]|nr:FAD:protein FMN transferase [Bacteroidales bacterium]
MRLKLLITTAVCAVIAVSCSDKPRYYTVEGFAQGGTWHIICGLPGGVRPQKVKALADSLLLEIDRSVSGYNRGSLLSRLNSGEEIPLDRHFISNFEESKAVWELSGGAFDPSAAPLFDLWGFGFTGEETVSDRAVDSILAFVGMDHFRLEERDGETFLVKDDPRCKLNFNAIAQGYSCDCIAAALEEMGCRDYLVEVGREIVCKGRSARGGKWRIALEKPEEGADGYNPGIEETLELTDCGIVTSGNYRKFYEKDGKKYAHTIDPSTGRPVTHNLLSATVILSDPSFAGHLAARSDAYATWMMVIGSETARSAADT